MRSNIEHRYTYGHWVYSENSGAPSLGIFDLELTYDANSAIKTLKRTGKQNTSGTYGIIDDLTYSYSGGRLQDVTDHAAKTVYDGAFNFTDNTINTQGGAIDYAYNANGALTRDYNKGISSISYDQFGNPFKVTFGNKSSIEYVYSADGVKLKARHITAIPQGTGSSSSSTNYIMSKDSTDYMGDFIYHNNKFSKYNWGNGYIVPTGSSSGYAYRFYFKDHQGNNRVVTTSTGTVKQTTHYYPDGVTHDKSTEQGEQVYKYNGKELDRMHGLDWYDYAARQYDPTIGQFISMDPLCEKYYHISPYAYCAGNPVRYVDPDGRDWYQNNKTSYYTWFNGDAVRDGFTHVGGKGSLLGEFEPKINNILIDVYKKERGLYSEGSIVDITDPNKGAIIPSQLLKMNDFLDEFVFGYGPEISILTENHPYTKTLQTDDRILESQQKLQKGNTAIPGQITKVNRSWGPLDVLSTTSIAKQFVGSYTFDSYTSYDKNHLLNIIYDTKNSRSLFYHIPGTAYLNHSRNSILKPFANTYQFYIWKSRK